VLGQKLTHYEITGRLGVGGMGEVYRAKDTKLDREVAIKVLPKDFAAHPERMARFEREAKALARLNHPNVAAIHGFDQQDGLYFLVLELIEGETLQERIQRGPMSVEESLQIFQQIAEALESAHEQNIVHRDLKPANIKIDPRGRVKVLDFGLAKARLTSTQEGAFDDDETSPNTTAPNITSEFTLPGRVMGTAAYMSPEQSRGMEVDRRTDVWAFGCCLYEALTGKKPFIGKTSSDLLAEILKTDPDFTVIPPETPSEVMTLLRRSLEKDPRKRLRDLGDIAITLEDVSETSRIRWTTSVPERTEPAPLPPRTNPISIWKWASIGGLVFVLALVYALLQPKPAASTMKSAAILPFDLADEIEEGTELADLGRTMHDAIRNKLRDVRGLKIVNMPLTTRRLLLSTNKTERLLAEELNVDTLVFGAISQRGKDIQASIEMMDRGGFDQGGRTLSKLTNEISEFSGELALAIIDDLGIEVSATQRDAIAKPITSVSTAFLAFQRGLDLFDRRDLTTAKVLFDEAFRKDSDFIDAQAYAFNAEILQTIFGNEGDHPADLFESKSTELNSLPKTGADNPTIRLNQLWWEWMYRRDWQQVEKIYWETRRAGKLTGDDLSLISNYYSLIRGDLNESLRLIDEALEQDPERLFFRKDQIFRQMAQGDFDEALRLLESLLTISREELELDPFHWIYIEKNQLDKAMAWAEHIDSTDPSPFTTISIATIHALRNEPDKAKEIMEALETRASGGDYLPCGWMAKGYAYQGNMEKAIQWLQKGEEQGRGDFSMLAIRAADMLKLFSDQPAYWEVITEMKFPPLLPGHPYFEAEQRMRYSQQPDTTPDSFQIKTLRVFPFDSAKEQDDYGWLSATLHDALIRQLKPIRQLTIKPVESTDVDATVEGTFVTEGNQLYVSVMLKNHLKETEDGLLSETYVANDILGLQNKIAIAVAKQIRDDLSSEDLALIALDLNVDPDAYIEFRKGIDALDVLGFARAEEGIAHFEEARRLDPEFLPPYIQQAWATWWPTIYGSETLTSSQAFDKAFNVLQSAQSRDAFSDNPIIGVTRDFFLMTSHFNFLATKQALESSLNAHPNDPDLLYMRIWYLLLIESRYGEAYRDVQLAISEAPHRRVAFQDALGEIYSFMGNEEMAIEINTGISDENAHDFDRLCNNAFSYKNLGNHALALQSAQEARRVSDNHPAAMAIEAEILAAMGKASEARNLLSQVDTIRDTGKPIPHNWSARVLIELGDIDAAVKTLRTAYQNNEGWSFLYTMRYPYLVDRLADHPGYWDLVNEMGYPEFPIDHPLHEKEKKMR